MADAETTEDGASSEIGARELLKRARRLSKRFRVTDGAEFRLADVDPGDTLGLTDEFKPQSQRLLQATVEALAQLQDKLYAQDRWGVLLIFQAMDAAGKDGAIKHVMSGVNPTGCEVTSFKAPSSEELDHDWLWRGARALPRRGHIGIHNRSWYEEALVVRVHPGLLAGQKLPPQLVGKRIWDERLKDMRRFEQYLSRNGVLVRKFFLHVSKKEQKRRFLERIDDPEKNWKFSPQDVKERGHWSAYMEAYEQAIRATASKRAPWYVVPADNKWFTRLVIASAIATELDGLDLAYPTVDEARKAELAACRKLLTEE
jgi:PPK2 family polyphosphate:nucleotide phosphotransferase